MVKNTNNLGVSYSSAHNYADITMYCLDVPSKKLAFSLDKVQASKIIHVLQDFIKSDPAVTNGAEYWMYPRRR